MKQQSLPLSQVNPGKIWWQPQPDITAYELAQAIQFLTIPWDSSHAKACMFVGLPDTVRRHFQYELLEA